MRSIRRLRHGPAQHVESPHSCEGATHRLTPMAMRVAALVLGVRMDCGFLHKTTQARATHNTQPPGFEAPVAEAHDAHRAARRGFFSVLGAGEKLAEPPRFVRGFAGETNDDDAAPSSSQMATACTC